MYRPFACGLEGSNPEHAQAVEDLVLEVLSEVAEQGADEGQVQAVSHRIEPAQRDITGGHFGIRATLMVKIMTRSWTGAIPSLFWTSIRRLRTCARPYDIPTISGLGRQLLSDDRIAAPDHDAGIDVERAPRRRRGGALGGAQGRHERGGALPCHRYRATLQARQLAEPNLEVLPKVTVADVPPELKIAW